jgi:hypothetical protein
MVQRGHAGRGRNATGRGPAGPTAGGPVPVRRRRHLGAALLASAAASVVALGAATGGVASAATATYTAQATSTGAEINLFGTELTGGQATVAVDTATPSVTATGTGTLTPALVEKQTASVTKDGASQSEPNACSQGGGLPAGLPVGLSLGLACASASASLSATNVPSGTASATVTPVSANVGGLLNQIIQSGGSELFTALQGVLGQLNSALGTGTASCPSASGSGSSGSNPLSGLTSLLGSGSGTSALSSLLGTLSSPSSPLSSLLGSLGLGGGSTGGGSPLSSLTGGSGSSGTGLLGNLLEGVCQTLTNIERVVKSAQVPNTVVVTAGPATASVVGTGTDTAIATANGATLDVQILPGVGCTASTLTACVTDPTAYAAPLVEIKVASAKSTDTFNGATWTPSSSGALATIDLNIPGFAQTISLATGQSLDLLAGTPLETVIDLGSASTSGATGTANGATVDLLKGVSGGILVNLGSATVTGDVTATAPASQPSHGSSPVLQSSTGVAPTPTAVHTGEWWAGSLPFLAGMGAVGGGLIAWPRLRRLSSVARLAARVRR